MLLYSLLDIKNKKPMTEQEIPKTLQRPDLGVETIAQADAIQVSKEQFPWISDDVTEVPTVHVLLEDGDTSFRYGSLVGGNHAIEKLADDVPPQQSKNAEQGMFKALASLLNGRSAPSVDRMTQYVSGDMPVYKTAKKGADVARLYFAITSDENGQPVVFKLGVAQHKKQDSLLAILKNKPGDKRKKDGGKR